RNRAIYRIAAGGPHVEHAAGVRFERFDRRGLVALDRLRLGLPQLHVQAPAQIEDDAVLELEDLVHATVDLHRAQQRPLQHLDELRRDADAITNALIRARHDPPGPEPPADLDRQAVAAAPGLVLDVLQLLEHLRAADHRHVADVSQVRGHRLGDAGTYPVVSRIAGD